MSGEHSTLYQFIMGPFFALAKKPLHNEARPRERSDRGCFLPTGKTVGAKRPRPLFAFTQKSLFIPGYVQGSII